MAGVSAIDGAAVVAGAVVSAGSADVAVTIDVDEESGVVLAEDSSDELHPAASTNATAIPEVKRGMNGL